MSVRKSIEASDFGGPAVYRIVVQGAVGESWRNRLGGMAITTSGEETGESQTTLCGWIRDQAELHGLLETLYALHLPILEVKHIPNLPNGGPAERGGNK